MKSSFAVGLRAAACAALLAGCSPQFDWREIRLAEQRCMVALPDKPQTAQRELQLPGAHGGRVTMTMVSTGVGSALFAVGVAQLPPAAVEAAQLEATVAWFRDGLLRNLGAAVTSQQPATLAAPAGRSVRLGQALRAEARAGANGRKTALAARFFVVDDRLYQLVAINGDGELPPLVLDTFFDSFRLTD